MSNYTSPDLEQNDSDISVWDYQEFEEFWVSSKEYIVFWALKTFAPPFVVVSGCIGNGLVILALRKHCIRSQSIGFYLLLLLAFYFMLLVSTVGLEWISYVSQTPQLAESGDNMCRIMQFLYSVINHSPYWIIALMLTDRTVYVCLPIYSSSFCTVFVAKLITIFMFTALITVNIHMMWTYELSIYGCRIDPHQQDFYSTIWPWIAATVNCYLPLLYIHVLIFASVIGLCMIRQQDFTVNHCYTAAAIKASMAFVIFNNPSVILNLIQYSKPTWLYSYQSYATMYMIIELFQTLVWLNMSIAYIVYLIAVPKLNLRFHPRCPCQKREEFQPASASSIEEAAPEDQKELAKCSATEV